MLATATGPNERELSRLFDGPDNSFRLNRKTILIAGGVIAVYAALGFYLAGQKYVFQAFEFTDPAPVSVRTVPLPKDPPPPQPDPEPRTVEQSPARNPVPTEFDPPKTLPTPPVNDPIPADGPIERLPPTPPTPKPAPPRVEPSPPAMISNPTWLRQPGAREFADFYPDRAIRLGRGGAVQMSCVVTVDGNLSQCAITAESPQNMGFGDAALRMAPYFQMLPQTRDGAPVGGARVNVPLRFAIDR